MRKILICLITWFVCTGAVTFDGTNYLCQDNPTTTNMPSGTPLTVGAWIYPTSVTGARQIFQYGELQATSTGYGFYTNGDELGFVTYGIKAYDSTTFTIVVNEWQYVSASLDTGDDVDLYHYRLSTNTWTTQNVTHTVAMNAPTSNSDMFIGAEVEFGGVPTCTGTTEDQFFIGDIMALEIWDTLLTSAQIHSIAESGLIRSFMIDTTTGVSFPLDEVSDGATSSTVKDLINGYVLTDVNSTKGKAQNILSYPSLSLLEAEQLYKDAECKALQTEGKICWDCCDNVPNKNVFLHWKPEWDLQSLVLDRKEYAKT